MNYIEKTFPYNNWYIEITDENRAIINEWKIQQEYKNDLFLNLQYKYVNWNGLGGRGARSWLITTEEFIQFVHSKTPINGVIIPNERLTNLLLQYYE